MQKHKLTSYLDYLVPIIIWLIIFGRNALSPLLFVDYVYPTFFTLSKMLVLSNYTAAVNPFHLLQLIFAVLGIPEVLFQFSVLSAMIVSFFFIKKTFPEKIQYILFAVIYFFNPFVYTRIMIGQLGVLLAYLFIPVFVFYMLEFLKKDFDKKSLVKMIIAFTLASLFSIHFFVINFIILVCYSIYNYKDLNKKFAKSLIIFIIFTLLLNAFWLQGIFNNPIYSSINKEHEQFFSPKMSENIPAVGKIIGMWGFWRENGFIRTYKELPLYVWYPLLIILFLLFVISWTNDPDKKQKRLFFTLFWTGLILGTGISHPYFSGFFDFLFNKLPLFSGFRDSHKFVSLIALSYAYFISSSGLMIKGKKKKIAFCVFIIIFMLFFTYPLIDLKGQIKPVSYPKDYFELNDYLNGQNISGYIMYLPWQTYLTYNWTINTSSDGRIAAPINNIIEKEVLIGYDEYGGKDILGQNISDCLLNNSAECLEFLNVQYIIKDKCTTFPNNYSWLNNAVFENSCISLYKLNAGEKTATKTPMRFYIGVLISLVALIILILYCIKYNRYNKEIKHSIFPCF